MTPEFEKMIAWGGTPVAQCLCGRTHYVASGENMDHDGELQRMEARHKADPKRYIPDPDNSSISVGTFNGSGPYVWNCPCGALDRLEIYLWENRNAIVTYIRERAARELKDATALNEAVSGI